MLLATRFSGHVSLSTQAKGRLYYAQRRAKIVLMDSSRVDAVVAGSLPYDVSLQVIGDFLQVSCTCPFAVDQFCKHIWATFLAADAAQAFVGLEHWPARLLLDDPYLDDLELE